MSQNLTHCIKCKAEFRQLDSERIYKLCLDCRNEMGERARRPAGQDLAEWMSTHVGSRITRGFHLMRHGEEVNN